MKIADAIITQESHWNCNQKGKSGEAGCAQWMPGQFENASKECEGYVVPMTKDNERYILACRVNKQLVKGRTAYEIALIHNSGGINEIKGVNKYGASYDTVAYANAVLKNIKN